MQKRDWRLVYTDDFPKMKQMSAFLQERLEEDNPAVLAHLEADTKFSFVRLRKRVGNAFSPPETQWEAP